eukprot:637835-Pleurochrysis_carterae.AAC.1
MRYNLKFRQIERKLLFYSSRSNRQASCTSLFHFEGSSFTRDSDTSSPCCSFVSQRTIAVLPALATDNTSPVHHKSARAPSRRLYAKSTRLPTSVSSTIGADTGCRSLH